MRLAAGLTDDALTLEVARLAGREREATAAFIAHLGEFAARRLYEGAGYPSMFAYCRAVLRLSEDAAYDRIKAAWTARDYPEIVAMLAEGSLSLTTVRLLAGFGVVRTTATRSTCSSDAASAGSRIDPARTGSPVPERAQRRYRAARNR